MLFQISSQAPYSDIIHGLGTITDWVKTWAVPLAAIGTVSMALLQTAKNLLPLRSWFQRSRIRKWLNEAAEDSAKSTQVNVCASSAETDLIALATSGDEDAFYNLPIEDLCGQIRNAVPVIMDYPNLHSDVFHCLASEASARDVQRLTYPPPPETFFRRGDDSRDEEKVAIREYAAAKMRLAAQVRCSVDAIQTSIGFQWKYSLQLASLILSAIIGVIALNLGTGRDHPLPTIGATVMIGLLSGFLAPVARDLVAAIEKWRT
jgi:hypothetical protein